MSAIVDTGRMASADPFVVDPLSNSGWNRYAYVLNQPLARTDPSGFMPTAASTDPDSSSDSEPQDFGFEMTVPVVGTRTAEGIASSGQAQQGDIGGGGSASARADQQAGDIGPSAAQIQQLHDSARARGAALVRQLNAPTASTTAVSRASTVRPGRSPAGPTASTRSPRSFPCSFYATATFMRILPTSTHSGSTKP
ncbi:hypothetical protein [Pseudenhygromyxa sp. WMMC2535]|uniref:hypothetical protein n=1 Tax=Pseudenhygromyxa sp. WMMC2535 TaxID=2712867 RepID=UPI0020D0E161|nr:hypothetical protein [Pseudenhygromyxa sp. WMMC2535]